MCHLADLYVLVGDLATTVEVAESLADLSTLAPKHGGVRSIETPESIATESITTTGGSLDSGFYLGPFLVQSLPSTVGAVLAIVWPANPYGGNVSHSMATLTFCQGGPVAVDNITPPLMFDMPQSQVSAVESGHIWVRRCVFWNTTTRSWRTEGVETLRKNLTHVMCSSSHATSFTVEFLRQACSFCATEIPATHLQVEFQVHVATWIAVAIFSLLYLSCLLPCRLDQKDWKAPVANPQSYFRPHHRVRARSSCFPCRARKKQLVGARRQLTDMRMKDFEATDPSAVLQRPSPSGSRRLYVPHPSIFRSGATVVLNHGEASEETCVVSNFTPESQVISAVLLHTHAAGEVVVQLPRESGHAVVEDVREGEHLVIDVSPAAVTYADHAADTCGSAFGDAFCPSADVERFPSMFDLDPVLDVDSTEASGVSFEDTSLLTTLCGRRYCHDVPGRPSVHDHEASSHRARAKDMDNTFDQLDTQVVGDASPSRHTVTVELDTTATSVAAELRPHAPLQAHPTCQRRDTGSTGGSGPMQLSETSVDAEDGGGTGTDNTKRCRGDVPEGDQ